MMTRHEELAMLVEHMGDDEPDQGFAFEVGLLLGARDVSHVGDALRGDLIRAITLVPAEGTDYRHQFREY